MAIKPKMCPLQYAIHSLYTQFTNSLKRTVSAKMLN